MFFVEKYDILKLIGNSFEIGAMTFLKMLLISSAIISRQGEF